MTVTVDKFSRMGEELLRYGGDSSQTATTMQQMQDYMVLEANTVGNLTDCLLWQPKTTYSKGAMVHSPNIPAGYVAEATSDSGQTGQTEPGWDVNYSTYTDGTVAWKLVGQSLSQYTKTTDSPMFNKRDVITTSGNYTAPVSGWYKITVKGGGGGGCGGNGDSGYPRAGASGGEGGTKIIYKKLTQNDTVAVVIGAGGAGGDVSQKGGAGGDSSVTIDGTVYTGGGAVQSEHIFVGGKGGAGDIAGASGCGALSSTYNNTGVFGGAGAGNGGGVANISTYAGGAAVANSGAGGAGGGGANTSGYAGGAGAAGFVWFEYFDETLN